MGTLLINLLLLLLAFCALSVQAQKSDGYLRKNKEDTKKYIDDHTNRFLDNVFLEEENMREKAHEELSVIMTDTSSARFIVKYKSRVHMQAMHTFVLSTTKSSTSQVVMTFEDSNMEVVTMDDEEDIAVYLASGNLDYMEPDPIRFLFDTSASSSVEIAMGEEVVPYGINLVKALLVSDENIDNRKLCIIDTGYDLAHEDLPKGDITGSAYLDKIWSKDPNGHGSHVAGTITANQNGIGVVGVVRNGNLRLHIERLLRDNGSGFIYGSNLILAAQNCVKAGSNVISMSLGGIDKSQAEEDAFRDIYEIDNVLSVAASGNFGNSRCAYPACHESVVSVGAIDEDKKVALFSQRNDQVELAAPGVDVLSVESGGGYRKYSGTSMACPHVAGVAALVWSHYPDKSAREIRAALGESAEDLGDVGRDKIYGFGLVRADRAFLMLDENFTLSPTTAPTPQPPCFDSPTDYVNSRGQSCNWYEGGFLIDRCRWYGSAYANSDGITGREACCICGGGRIEYPDSTDSPTLSPIVSTDNPTLAPVDNTPSPTSEPTKTFSPTQIPTISPTSSPTTGECRDTHSKIMRTVSTTVLLLILAFGALLYFIPSQKSDKEESMRDKVIEGSFIVSYKSREHMQAMHTFLLSSSEYSKFPVVQTFESLNMEVVIIEDKEDISVYLESGNVISVEADQIVSLDNVYNHSLDNVFLEEESMRDYNALEGRFIVSYKSREHMQAMHAFLLSSSEYSKFPVVQTFESLNMEVVIIEDEEDISVYLESGKVISVEPDQIVSLGGR
ncbi:peptidase S8 [Chaetoceros tenuissimus]|uniref:subtilisin n=1 Tax=Chaetoceros tenuissimus TaxID=426638 RepID=A0AAD3H1P6_9STRA|nr:peptidase S8 [Chaetoceros tenuissimus]